MTSIHGFNGQRTPGFSRIGLVILKELEILVVLRELDWYWLVCKDFGKKIKKLTDIGFLVLVLLRNLDSWFS